MCGGIQVLTRLTLIITSQHIDISNHYVEHLNPIRCFRSIISQLKNFLKIKQSGHPIYCFWGWSLFWDYFNSFTSLSAKKKLKLQNRIILSFFIQILAQFFFSMLNASLEKEIHRISSSFIASNRSSTMESSLPFHFASLNKSVAESEPPFFPDVRNLP